MSVVHAAKRPQALQEGSGGNPSSGPERSSQIPNRTPLLGRPLALAPSQRDIWQDHRAYPDQAHLTIGGCAFLRGPVRPEVMKAAGEAVAAECSALRLSLDPLDGRQALLEHARCDFSYQDYSNATDPVSAIHDRWRYQASRPIPLIAGQAPWFMELIKASDTLYGLMPLFHHAIMDGYGTSVMVRRLADHYTAIHDGTPLPPMPGATYEDFIAESLAYEKGPAFSKDLAAWSDAFADLPPPLLSPLKKAPLRTAGDVSDDGRLPPAHLESQPLARALYHRIEDASKAMGATPFHLCVAALALLLQAQTGHRDVVIAVPTLNRAGRIYRQTVGLFVGLLPLRLTVDLNDTVATLVQQVGQKLRVAYRHRRVSLTQLGHHLHLLRHGRERLFDVVFSFEILDYACSFGPARLSSQRQLFSGTARYPLGVTLCDFANDQDLELMFEASSQFLEAPTAARWGHRLLHILSCFCDTPQSPLHAVSLCPPAESAELLNLGTAPPPGHLLAQNQGESRTVLTDILSAAQRTPSAICVRTMDGSWTYDDVLTRAAAFTAILANTAPTPTGQTSPPIIGLHLPPGPDLIAAMIAVMAHGAAFLPLDCEAPLSYRLQRLKDCTAVAVIADHRDQDLCAAPCPVLCADSSKASPTPHQASPLQTSPLQTPPWQETLTAQAAAPQALAYVLFTSGSSGTPKAVAVSHRALWTRLTHLADLWEITEQDCGGALARPTFDPSLLALLMPLLRGGSVALPARWRMGAEEIGQFICATGVTCSPLVPATLAMVRDGLQNHQHDHRLRVVSCGGEALSPALAQSFQAVTGAQVDNLYGPTEATIYATRWPCPRPESPPEPQQTPPVAAKASQRAWPEVLPIGRPVAGTLIRLLDSDGRLVPYGEAGEIALGGDGLADGYLASPHRTAQRFVTLDFGQGPERLYRTGDAGRWNDDGDLLFLGRLDRQIKLNGQRIEPGEIEAVLQIDPEVSAAVVDVRGENCGRRLHGWVISTTPNPQGLTTRLLDAIAERLPLHMSLASLSVLPSAPLTASGKIDLAALPVPAPSAHGHTRHDTQADDEPTTPLERELARLWAQALAQSDGSPTDPRSPPLALGLHDNLFTMGGDSLSAMTVLTGLERMVGPGLPLSLLVRQPTIASQVRALGEVLSHRAIRLARHQGATPAAPVFIAASGHGDALRFRGLADALAGGHDVFMLQPPLAGQLPLDGTATPQAEAPDFAHLAATYADLIQATLRDQVPQTAQDTPLAPVLIGFSLGGVAALETARCLSQRGQPVAQVILLDTTYPYPSPIGERVWRGFAHTVRALGLHHRVKSLWRWIAMLEDQGLGWQMKALHRYRPTPYHGPVALLISSGLRPLSPFLFGPWKRLIPHGLVKHRVKGLHGSLLQPGRVEALADTLRRLISR